MQILFAYLFLFMYNYLWRRYIKWMKKINKKITT